MLKWIVVIVLVVVLSGWLQTRPARKLRLGHLPGDLRLRLGGQELRLPFASTLLLSLVAWLLLRLL